MGGGGGRGNHVGETTGASPAHRLPAQVWGSAVWQGQVSLIHLRDQDGVRQQAQNQNLPRGCQGRASLRDGVPWPQAV